MALQNPIKNPPTIVDGHRKYTVTAADLAGLGAFTSGDIILDTLEAGSIVNKTRVKHTTAVAGPSISAATARVITANNNYGGGTLDVFQAPSATAAVTDVTGASENIATTTPLLLHVVTTGANLSAVTAGQIEVEVDHEVLD